MFTAGSSRAFSIIFSHVFDGKNKFFLRLLVPIPQTIDTLFLGSLVCCERGRQLDDDIRQVDIVMSLVDFIDMIRTKNIRNLHIDGNHMFARPRSVVLHFRARALSFSSF